MRQVCTAEYQAGRPYCGQEFEDVDHYTYCPHDLIPSREERAKAVEALLGTGDQVEQLAILTQEQSAGGG